MYHYRIYFTQPGKPNVAYQSIHAPSPASALDHFHARMQMLNSHGPDDYAITRLTQLYPDIKANLMPSFANMIEAEIDLPRSPNPKLKAQIEAPNYEQTAFPFGVE